jgi:hypothetical protein
MIPTNEYYNPSKIENWGTCFELFKQEFDYEQPKRKFPVKNILDDERFFVLSINPHMKVFVKPQEVSLERVLYKGNRLDRPLSTLGKVICNYHIVIGKLGTVVFVSREIETGETIVVYEAGKEANAYSLENNTDLVQDFLIERKLKEPMRR